jgi:hypothetical protein
MRSATPELIAKAKAAKSAAELYELAKTNGIELTEEDAKTFFEQLNSNGAVSDDELDGVSGGSGCYSIMQGSKGGITSGTNRSPHSGTVTTLENRYVFGSNGKNNFDKGQNPTDNAPDIIEIGEVERL